MWAMGGQMWQTLLKDLLVRCNEPDPFFYVTLYPSSQPPCLSLSLRFFPYLSLQMSYDLTPVARTILFISTLPIILCTVPNGLLYGISTLMLVLVFFSSLVNPYSFEPSVLDFSCVPKLHFCYSTVTDITFVTSFLTYEKQHPEKKNYLRSSVTWKNSVWSPGSTSNWRKYTHQNL